MALHNSEARTNHSAGVPCAGPSPAEGAPRVAASANKYEAPGHAYTVLEPNSSPPWRRRKLVEFFCGSAGLSLAFLATGTWETIGIDWRGNRARPAGFNQYLELDLRQPQAEETALHVVSEDSTQAVHIALPCGTGSRAREIPLPAWKSQRHLGIPDPGPLRSEAEPWGISTVTDPIDLARLDSSNKLIRFVLKVAAICRTRGIPCIVENPWRSLLWDIPELWALVSDSADFSACMTGG